MIIQILFANHYIYWYTISIDFFGYKVEEGNKYV